MFKKLIGGLLEKMIFKSGTEKLQTTHTSLFNISAARIAGATAKLEQKKVTLVVNLASK